MNNEGCNEYLDFLDYKVKEERVFHNSSYRESDGYDRVARKFSAPSSSNFSVLRLLSVPFYIMITIFVNILVNDVYNFWSVE